MPLQLGNKYPKLDPEADFHFNMYLKDFHLILWLTWSVPITMFNHSHSHCNFSGDSFLSLLDMWWDSCFFLQRSHWDLPQHMQVTVLTSMIWGHSKSPTINLWLSCKFTKFVFVMISWICDTSVVLIDYSCFLMQNF